MNCRPILLQRRLIALTLPALFCALVYCTASAAAQAVMPVATNDQSVFELIFDGKSLRGWEGDTNYWRVEDGRQAAADHRFVGRDQRSGLRHQE